ncbi:MAG: cytochrome c family protein [Candidatus Marinimicrobia bacterium]|nr:cytochrome c family protein [Candidatus Neomarinimicrobiota bacterium]MCF7828485.1 cytochrome c family protein [Candidatus Neomarinimicrobiota bacterium]MCF7881975.1 cytochrome c family protein [Candidatus Neomarinimicrobiota bacterium]
MKILVQVCLLVLFPLTLVFGASDGDTTNFEFSHKYHNEMGLGDCSTCHMSATESTTGTDDLLPNAETCTMCHGDAVTPPTNLKRITDYQTIFSHKRHAVDEEIECSSCHEGILEDEAITADHLPTMNDCYSCHMEDVKQVPEDCGMCHGPEERLTPKTHTATWENYHGMKVSSTGNRGECATCHVEESFCQDCHFGDNVVQQTHPTNWEYTHGIEARRQSTDCSTCHESKQFCADCHQANLVMPITHSVPSWATKAGGGRHAEEATMDIDNCASCHTNPADDPTCLECHSN